LPFTTRQTFWLPIKQRTDAEQVNDWINHYRAVSSSALHAVLKVAAN
jgi:hypothetical protein